MRWWRHESIIDPPLGIGHPKLKAPCSIEGCDGHAVVRGWCQTHYDRWHRFGDPLVIKPFGVAPRPAADRFWEKVDKTGACWLWTGGLDKDGYGYFNLPHNRKVRAHRWAYEAAIGQIPKGLEVDHLCRIHACVNPDHLEAVTGRENRLRGDTKRPNNTGWNRWHPPVKT